MPDDKPGDAPPSGLAPPSGPPSAAPLATTTQASPTVTPGSETPPLSFSPGWSPQSQPVQAVNLSVGGGVPPEVAILQKLPPEAVLKVLENSNQLATRQLELQDKSLERALLAEEKQKDRLHQRALAKDGTTESRWNKLFAMVCVLSTAVLFGAWLLYQDHHVELAVGLVGTLLSFAAGFAAGKGYEHQQEKNAEK